MDQLLFFGVLLLVGYTSSDLRSHYCTEVEIHWSDRYSPSNCSAEVTCCINTIHVEDKLFNDPLWQCLNKEELDDENESNEDFEPECRVPEYISLRLVGVTAVLEFTNDDVIERINKISLMDNSVDVPKNLYKLTALEDIEINNYNIRILNLTRFYEFNELNKLNVSHNLITDIAFNISSTSKTSKLKILDLSHNLLENVQCSWKLGNYAELIYLDLSYNSIKNIDELAFEGLVQLRNLFLTHNHILNIGGSLSKLNSIEEIALDHNKITVIEEPNFAGLKNIGKLNLSTNSISVVEVQSFGSLTKLKDLDVSNNQIRKIQKQLFINNNQLCSLSLSNNNIEVIETGAFSSNITKFKIEKNPISVIDKSFQAIQIPNIDLSGMKIASIRPQAFSAAVHNLNLSHNSINEIADTAFSEAENLERLDLSHNWLRHFNFNTSSMTMLSSLYLQNNNIDILKQNILKTHSLRELDLSENWNILIQNKSFTHLKRLEILRFNNNKAMKYFEDGTFDGLVSLLQLDFAISSISELQNNIFSDLKQLELLNASRCQIVKIQYNAFKNLETIEKIDLSHNLVTEFSVNNKDIAQVKQLYLGFNKIKRISNETFYGLPFLVLLDLSSNNIVQLGDHAFIYLRSLNLSLDSNPDMEIQSESFSNLNLSSLVLRNVTKRFNFEHTSSTSVLVLDLSSCQIEDIASIHVNNLNVNELLLNSNQITQLNKHSLQNLSSLEYLDVSFNSISYIQPGTFRQLNNLKTLNLHDNDLTKLHIGVFDGLRSLQILNLSYNEISYINGQHLRTLPDLELLILDNNNIINSDIVNALGARTKISIGGNKIPCSCLIKLYGASHVTAIIPVYHSENVNGITCSQDEPIDSQQINESIKINATFALQNAIDKLRNTIDNKISLANVSDGRKPLLYIITVCLLVLVGMCLAKFVPRVLKRNFQSRRTAHSSTGHLMDDGVELE